MGRAVGVRKMQFSDRHLETFDGWIIGAQKFNFAARFPPKGGFSALAENRFQH